MSRVAPIRYGLRLFIRDAATHQMEMYTPRNLEIAYTMVEQHALQHGRGYEYRIEDWRPCSTFEPIRLENL